MLDPKQGCNAQGLAEGNAPLRECSVPPATIDIWSEKLGGNSSFLKAVIVPQKVLVGCDWCTAS